MTKHLADHRSPSQGGRVKNFVNVEKLSGDEGSHPASKKLAKRGVERSDTRRMQEYLRIERGHKA
jgi:hypothetical protein